MILIAVVRFRRRNDEKIEYSGLLALSRIRRMSLNSKIVCAEPALERVQKRFRKSCFEMDLVLKRTLEENFGV